MKGSLQIMLIFVFALLLRWCITYHPHSGEGKPPMFGDYEAQRHWQEITLNLPIEKWYINTTDNDLQYWGLDYPPLTAYHSLLIGHIANKINFSYVKLNESRGFTSDSHKYFMRLTVLSVDALIYVPAVIYFMLNNQIISNSETNKHNIFGFKKEYIVILTSLIYPGLILIDHGHFQYNCVSLGLFISAVTAMLNNSFIFGSVLFVTALNYKQMELYHALPIFFYILGRCTPTKQQYFIRNLKMLLWISFTVVFTFCIIWIPFLKNWETMRSVVFRLFPFARGVFEDKVANVWCAINVVYKLRNVFRNEQLAKICLIITAIAVLPSSIHLYLHPRKEKFVICLINSALAFFLFSFQVHEKSILLASIPVLLHFQTDPLPCFWFLLISHFSMLPLFLKDDLYLAYIVTICFYFLFVSWTWPDIFDMFHTASLNDDQAKQEANATVMQSKPKVKLIKHESITIQIQKTVVYYYKNNFSIALRFTFYSSVLGLSILSIASGFLKPPEKYPDLFSLLVSLYSCGHFIIFYLYFNYKQFCTEKIIKNKSKIK